MSDVKGMPIRPKGSKPLVELKNAKEASVDHKAPVPGKKGIPFGPPPPPPKKTVHPDITSVSNDDIEAKDMISLITAAIDHTSLVGSNIIGYNRLIDSGLLQIATQLFKISKMIKNERTQTARDKLHKQTRLNFEFTDLIIDKPKTTTYPVGSPADLFPAQALITGFGYDGAMRLSAKLALTAMYADGHEEVKSTDIPLFEATRFPIMKGSNRCHTVNLTREALKAIGEDPNDPGGIFIQKNQEFLIELLENIVFNCRHTHKRSMPNEHVRSEFISQPNGSPFENSSQLIVRYMVNGALTIEINSTKLSKVRFPFYLIYRMMGMTSDREIVETIVPGAGSGGPVSVLDADILRIVEGAMHMAGTASDKDMFQALTNELDREKIVQVMAEKLSSFLTNTSYAANENAVQYLTNDLMNIIDKVVLSNIGLTADFRQIKLRQIGLIIRETLLTHLDILAPTDRDNIRNKRMHGAGVSLAKVVKTQINNTIIIPVIKAFKRDLKNNQFSSLTPANMQDTFRGAINQADFSRGVTQALTSSGDKKTVVNGKISTARISSVILERKNPLNTVSFARNITTHGAGAAKQTTRADMMRRVHASFTGYICVAQSADTGEDVGMKKQLACTASVCEAEHPLMLEMRLAADPAIRPLRDVTEAEIARRHLCRVYVNGKPVGVCESGRDLRETYRDLREVGASGVGPSTTIAWGVATNTLDFHLDVGRLTRPLIRVYNNLDRYDAVRTRANRNPADRVKFVQNMRFTMEHVRGILSGRTSLEDLRRAGIVEFITPEEAENCLTAQSIDELRRHRHNVTRRYTHVDVPQAIWGIVAHMSMYGNHTQPARITYETNQGRQTCGWYMMNFPKRIDKNRFFQTNNEQPLVRTLTQNYIMPSGINAWCALMPWYGNNQEDSAILSRGAVDRGLFAGVYFKSERVELEKGEIICNPDALTTKNLKPNASYEMLVDGVVPMGTVVHRGVVLVGRVAKISRTAQDANAASKYQFVDRSIMYRGDEPAIVDMVVRARDANDEPIVIVKLRFSRPLQVGDKMSNRAGNKLIVAEIRAESDMPYCEDGTVPDLIINPHSIPTRMTIGQLDETSVAKVCAHLGTSAIGTSFLPASSTDIIAALVDNGFRATGRERMYNGCTGECFEDAIFFGPIYEQRLQKFVLEDEYAVAGSGPTDATTGQPLGGKNAHGGLRLGEMEQWCLVSHGSLLNLHLKFGPHSGGRILNVCRACGHHAVCNMRYQTVNCRLCGEDADICPVVTTKAAIVLQQELQSSNIRMRLGLAPRTFDCHLPRAAEVRGGAETPAIPATQRPPAELETVDKEVVFEDAAKANAGTEIDVNAGTETDAAADAEDDPFRYVPDEFDPLDYADPRSDLGLTDD